LRNRNAADSAPRGAIAVEAVTRRFRVYPQQTRTLKELLIARRRARGRDVWALRGVSLRVEPGESVGLVGRNGSGKTTLLRLVAGIVKPTSGRIAVGGRVGSLLELGAGFHPDFTGRENVYLNGSIHGLTHARIRGAMEEIVAFAGLEEFIDLPVRLYSTGMSMRLGFAIASHIEADILLLDEVFAVGDEAFQRKCFGKILEFKQRGGTIVFVSHDAGAVERLCERAVLLSEGHVAFEGPSHEAVIAYRRLLAGERDPEERGAGLKEWGGGIARVEHARLLDAAGEERRQLLAGEPFALALDVAAEAPLPAPRLAWQLHDDGGTLVAAGALLTATLGWRDTSRRVHLRFDVERPPLQSGRFRFRFDLTDADGETAYHSLDDAVVFAVYSVDGTRGLVRLEGRWSLAAGPEQDGQVPSSNTWARSTLNPGLLSRSDSTASATTSVTESHYRRRPSCSIGPTCSR